ncbi:MAG: hypothetical protein IPG25_15205 [Proteobacteria bacterium]|nr:hypothetical protein [Pseudomonadota bacterium]
MVTDIDVDELDSGNDKRAKSKRKERKDPLPEVLPAMHSTHAGALRNHALRVGTKCQ